MASKNKLNKAKNSFCSNALKQGEGKLKRTYFMMLLNVRRIRK